MATRTTLNNDQVAKLTKYNKLGTAAIDITGSAVKASVAATDEFIIQAASTAGAKSVTAALMQDYFSKTDIVEATDDLAYKLVFTSGSGDSQDLKVDDDTLTWNASTEVLTIAGSAKATILSGSGDSTIHKITMNQLVASTADINGGSIDGTTIGTAASSSIRATTISGSGAAEFGSTIAVGGNADLNGTLDVAGATSLAAAYVLTNIRGTLSVDQAATFDSSLTVTGDLIVNGTTTTVDSQNLQVEDPMILMGTGSSGEGSAGDRGLIMAINGATNPVMYWDNSATQFAFARSETSGSTNTIVVDAYSDLRVLELSGSAISGSGASTLYKATLDQLVAATADIDGGSIDGATVGASSQSSVKATTLSGSSTLHVGGVATYGDGTLTISAAGLLSGSATATLANATLDLITVGSADVNGGAIDGATIGASSQSSVKATTLSGSSTLSLEGVASFGPGAKTVIAVDGGLTIDHFDAAWTNAGITVADLGTVTTVDINGGSVDGATIGAAVSSSVKATTLSGSGGLSVGGGAQVYGILAVTGAVTLSGVSDVVADIDADSFYFLDSDGVMKRDVMSDVLALAKGDGIQVSSTGLFSVPMVRHVYMSSSSEASWSTGSIAATATGSVFALGGNNYSSGVVTASFDVYLNGILQVRSGSLDNVTAWDYIITGSGTQVLFEPADSVAQANHTIDSDDVVVIKYLVK
jgi:hypothetical protein